MIEPSKFSYEAGLRMGMEEFLRKSIENSKEKKNRLNTSSAKKKRAQLTDTSKIKNENMRIFSHKNSLVRATRPTTAAVLSEHNLNSIDNNNNTSVRFTFSLRNLLKLK